MTRVFYTLVFGAAFLAATLSAVMPDTPAVDTVLNGPVSQATAPAPAPTPVPAQDSYVAAPIGEGTQRALVLVALVVFSGLLIGSGIYLRQRWMATRY